MWTVSWQPLLFQSFHPSASRVKAVLFAFAHSFFYRIWFLSTNQLWQKAVLFYLFIYSFIFCLFSLQVFEQSLMFSDATGDHRRRPQKKTLAGPIKAVKHQGWLKWLAALNCMVPHHPKSLNQLSADSAQVMHLCQLVCVPTPRTSHRLPPPSPSICCLPASLSFFLFSLCCLLVLFEVDNNAVRTNRSSKIQTNSSPCSHEAWMHFSLHQKKHEKKNLF